MWRFYEGLGTKESARYEIKTHRDRMNDFGNERLWRRVKCRRFTVASDENDGVKNFPLL